MLDNLKSNHSAYLLFIAVTGWIVPGGGYLLQGHVKRFAVICVTILLTFTLGLYVGSIGVIDWVNSMPWYVAQILTSPFVIVIGYFTAAGGYPVYARANEIGQIYTGLAGLLNLLCIVNAVHLAHTGQHVKED